MKVYKRKDSPFWWICKGDTHVKGNRKPTPLTIKRYTKRQAQSIMNQVGEKAFLKALGLSADEKTNTIKTVFDEFKIELTSKYGNNTTQCRANKRYVKQFVDFVGDSVLISDVTTKMVENYYFKRLSDDVAVTTVRKDRTYINQFFDMAVSSEYIKSSQNPTLKVRKGIIPKATPKNQKWVNNVIPEIYMERLLNDPDIPPEYRLFWRVQRWTGFDPGDALTLDHHNVDYENGLINCERDKNANETISFPMHHSLIGEEIINLQSQFHTERNPEKNLTKQTICKKSIIYMNQYLAEYGFKNQGWEEDKRKSVHAKSLRYTFCQTLVANGLEDTMRAKLMGQVDIKTQQVYTGADIEIMRKAIEGTDEIKAVA